jgi:hypothetical protein
MLQSLPTVQVSKVNSYVKILAIILNVFQEVELLEQSYLSAPLPVILV